MLKIRRGDVVLVDLAGALGVVKKDKRPCVVVLNDRLNRNAPFTVVLPITDRRAWRKIPEQVLLSAADLGPGGKDSVVSAAEIRQVDKHQIDEARGVLTRLPLAAMADIDAALACAITPRCVAHPALSSPERPAGQRDGA